MSERLTERNANGTAKSRKSPKSSYMGTVYEEVAEIQTEILNRLCDLEDKIEQGKIVELPCQIGDEKFAILPNTNVIVKGKVCTILYQNEFLIDFAYKSEEYDYTAYTQLLPEELFDTYEEAEAKLKGVNK